MFTGIINHIGIVAYLAKNPNNDTVPNPTFCCKIRRYFLFPLLMYRHVAKKENAWNFFTKADLGQCHNDLLIGVKLENSNINRNLDLGCSVACSGICLTLIKKSKKENYFYLDFQASEETIAKTNISTWQIGTKINLEFALKIGDELGGHMVSGHVDGIAIVKSIEQISDSHKFIFEFLSVK